MARTNIWLMRLSCLCLFSISNGQNLLTEDKMPNTDECEIEFNFSNESGDGDEVNVDVLYRENTLSSLRFNSTSTSGTVVLPFPIGNFLNKLELKFDSKTSKKFEMQESGVKDIEMQESGVKATLTCKAWVDTLKDVPHVEVKQAIKECVDKTSTFFDDSDRGAPREQFIYRWNSSKTHETTKSINVAFLFPGMNGNVFTDYGEYHNGARQGPMWFADMCSQLANESTGDFLLVFVPVMFPKHLALRSMYMELGMLYTQTYIQQAYVDPILDVLATQYGNTPTLIFGGYSMGGIIATLMSIHFSLDSTDRVRSVVLDPYEDFYGKCAFNATLGIRDEINKLRTSKEYGVGSPLVNQYREALNECKKNTRLLPKPSNTFFLAALYTFGTPLHSQANALLVLPFTIALTRKIFLYGSTHATGTYEMETFAFFDYAHFFGHLLHHDGHFVRELQDKNHNKPKVFHINHFSDRTVGLQANVTRAPEELGYVNSGVWEKKANNPSIKFACWFAKRQPEPLKSTYRLIDELPYAYEKLMLGPDSDELISLDVNAEGETIGGEKNHHSSHIANGKLWKDSNSLGYFARWARLHIIQKHIMDAVLPKAPKAVGDGICSSDMPDVRVTRDDEGIDTWKMISDENVSSPKEHVMRVGLIVGTPEERKGGLSALVEEVKADATMKYWLGQVAMTPSLGYFYNRHFGLKGFLVCVFGTYISVFSFISLIYFLAHLSP